MPMKPRKLSTWMLTLGLILFVLVTADVLAHGLLWQLDRDLAQSLKVHRVALWAYIFGAPTILGSGGFVTLMAVGIALLLALRKRWHLLKIWILGFAGAAVITPALKWVFHLPRPNETSFFHLGGGYTYPSGHTFGSMTLLGLLTILLWYQPAARRWWPWVAALAVLLCLLVAWGLVYVGAHYVADILAAASLCTAWLGFCWRMGEQWRPRSAPVPPLSKDAGGSPALKKKPAVSQS